MPTRKNKETDNFKEKVRGVVRKIPAGQTKSYAEVARLAGHPKAYRAVANIMAANHDSTVPCHRVIKSDGSVGGYNGGGPTAKLKKLLEEGWLP
ncbi:MAG: MGMT family protein [Candidatus Paceibacterota bacterium]